MRLRSRHWLILGAGVMLASGLARGHVAWATQATPGQVEAEAIDKRVDGWIEQLGDPSYIKRQNAKDHLEKIGLLAFERLRSASSHPNIEIATNAQYLLQSMRVVWTAPNDSFEVQRLLKDYNEFQPSQKLDRMQRLAKLHRADGDLALLRFVRFESDENLSKTAALHLMDSAIAKKSQRAPASWSDLIRSGLGDSQRAGAQWLRELVRTLDEKSADLRPWRQYAINERKLLESNSEKTSEQTVKRLYCWTAKWLAGQGRRDEALAFIEPSLDLLGNGPANTLTDVVWMLEEGLPEAVLKLAERKPGLFNRAQMRYLLAESYLKQGDAVQAERTAEEARKMLRMAPLAREEGKFDHEANQRAMLAESLGLRGLFDWAEVELRRAEALAATPGYLTSETELGVREELATFYWEADQPQRAAEVWRSVLERAGLPIDAADEIKQTKSPLPKVADRALLSVLLERNTDSGQSFAEYVPSSYHFYLGLAAIKAGDLPGARTELRAAVAFANKNPGVLVAINPDIVIAMSKAIDGDERFKAEVDQVADKLEAYFRKQLVQLESELAAATTRQRRLDAEMSIASACNQLAWLLANTGRKAQEAISLSERSVLLTEDSLIYLPIYLDTLARCYFAAGDVEKAIELQSRAVAEMPHERQMQRQLVEFQKHIASKDSTDKR